MIDELLGRLEATTVKFDIGRGGIPELTAQDIAAALGMCEDKFAVLMFEAVASGTIRDPAAVDKAIAQAQFAEWRNRMDRMVTAQLAMVEADGAPIWQRAQRRWRAKQMLEGAKAAMWPALVEEHYAQMRLALLTELRSNRVCPVCNGRKSVMVENTLIECEHCLGTGRIAISDRSRAQMMRMHHSTYRDQWKAPYEWMYRHLSDAVNRGRAQFSVAVGRYQRAA